jgi:uncharacterized protein (TIGR00369 family)
MTILDRDHRFFGVHVPFLAWLDIRSVRLVPGEAELELDLRPELMNSLDAAHGGVICTLVDVAMAAAARSDSPESRVVTVDMSVQFLHPGKGTLKAIGRARKVTRSLAFCEAEISDANGDLVARGTGVFKRLKPGRGDGDG